VHHLADPDPPLAPLRARLVLPHEPDQVRLLDRHGRVEVGRDGAAGEVEPVRLQQARELRVGDAHAAVIRALAVLLEAAAFGLGRLVVAGVFFKS
jgi:hypothetical protein